MTTQPIEPSSPAALPPERAQPESGRVVTLRALVLGLLLASALASLNAWIENVAKVHFLGGIQMPFGAIFALAFLILFLNGPLKLLRRGVPALGSFAPPLSATELLAIYAMMVFASLVSSPGGDNSVLTIGPGLFYFASRENGWASLFYSHIPPQFAPGWDGHTFQQKVIEPFYLGGLSPSQIPWHTWTMMLLSWGIFTLLTYSLLFFASLVLRKQWIENEALAFPLVQLPLHMVEGSDGARPPAREVWGNSTLWMGAGLAGAFHLLRGLNNYFPDFPALASFQGNVFKIAFTEVPWSSAGDIKTEFFFGAIGIAYLLTREMSFSFWFFFLLFKLQLVAATMAGFPAGNLPKDSYLGNPTFITWQSVGGWMMMAMLLVWSARGHVRSLWNQARYPQRYSGDSGEPFSARFIFLGLGLSAFGLLGWCWFSGINLIPALSFLGLYAIASLVLARLVVEGGFLYPQATFAPLETLSGSVLGAGAMGASSITKLAFLQPAMFSDMRCHLLPGFLHTFKIVHELKLNRQQARRFVGCAILAIIVSWGVSTFTTISTLYQHGGLTTYSWFSQDAPKSVFSGAAKMMTAPPGGAASNWGWLAIGGAIVWFLTFARARFLWFPLHPLAFIVSSGYPITRLWLSFFIGWAIKSLLLKFGGQDTAQRVRPFMIGLILGNAAAMVLWMLYGYFAGTYIPYWPA